MLSIVIKKNRGVVTTKQAAYWLLFFADFVIFLRPQQEILLIPHLLDIVVQEDYLHRGKLIN